MKIIIIIMAIAGLLITLLPSFFFLNEIISKDQLTTFMLVGTIIWFIFGTMWLGKKNKDSSGEAA